MGWIWGLLVACDAMPISDDGIGSDELLSGLVDLSQEVEALERRVAALDRRGAPGALGCTSPEVIESLLVGDAFDDSLSPQRPFGTFDGLLLSTDADPALIAPLGLRSGDRIVSVMGFPVDTPEAREQVVRTLAVASPSLVTLEIVRADGDRDVDDPVAITLRLSDACGSRLNVPRR